ncbi:unnamed protein product, partial [Brassica oleracea var. botrytis]
FFCGLSHKSARKASFRVTHFTFEILRRLSRFLFGSFVFVARSLRLLHVLYRLRDFSSCNGFSSLLYIDSSKVSSHLPLSLAARTVVTLLICLWDSRNINKNGEFMGITILLLDELYRPSLKAGSILRLDRFEVARVARMYKITEHQFLILFIPSTRKTFKYSPSG